MKEIKLNEGKYIIFVDEIHTIVGAGHAEGAMDASNLLKPALSKRRIKNGWCYYFKRISTTYRKRSQH